MPRWKLRVTGRTNEFRSYFALTGHRVRRGASLAYAEARSSRQGTAQIGSKRRKRCESLTRVEIRETARGHGTHGPNAI